jgi:hypothetical protein
MARATIDERVLDWRGVLHHQARIPGSEEAGRDVVSDARYRPAQVGSSGARNSDIKLPEKAAFSILLSPWRQPPPTGRARRPPEQCRPSEALADRGG